MAERPFGGLSAAVAAAGRISDRRERPRSRVEPSAVAFGIRSGSTRSRRSPERLTGEPALPQAVVHAMSSTAAPTSPPAGALQVFQAADSGAPCGGCLGGGVSGPLVIYRRTPDHPPYAEMIQVALRALAEEYGSTEGAISRRIAADYPDLPWAHDRLLHHYLRRAVAAGDVAVVAPGRYALLTPSAASVAGLNPVPANNPSPSLRVTSFPGAAPASTPQRSPSDNEAAVDCGAGEDLENQKAVLSLTAASPAVDGAHKLHRLSVHSVSDPATGDGFAGGQDEQPAEEDRPCGDAAHWNAQNVGKKKKGRGRPPLRKRGTERPPSRANDEWEWVSSVDAIDPTTGAIRTDIAEGGIPISLIPSLHGQDSSPVFKTPELPRKRRSRSPIKPTVVMSDLVSNDRDTLLRNADSFSEDFDHMKLGGDSYMSWSLGDGSSLSGDKVVSQCGTTERPKLILRLPVKRKEGLPEESSNSDLISLANQLTVRVPKRPRTSTDHNPRKICPKMSEEMVMSSALVQSTEQMAGARMSSVPSIQSTVCGEPIAQSSEQIICELPTIMKQDSRPRHIISSQQKIDGWIQVLLAAQPTSPNLRKSKRNKDMTYCNEGKLVKYTDDLIPSKLLLAREVQNTARVDSCLQASMSKHSDGDNLIEGKLDENIVEVDRCVHLISALNLDHVDSIHMAGEKITNVDQGTKHVAEYLKKRVANKELDNKPQIEGSILEYHMQQSRPEQTEVNETDSRMCLQVLPNSGNNLQTVNVTKPPMMEPLLEYAAEPYVTSGCLQSQMGSICSVGESIEQPNLQHLKLLDDLQYEGMNGLDCGNYVNDQHDQIILQDTWHFDRDKSEKQIHEPVVEFSALTHKNLDSFQMHQLQEESYDELCIQRIIPDLELSRGALETDAMCNKRCINLFHEEQQKLQITLLSEAEIVQAEEHASVTESERISDFCFQVQELDNRMQGDERHSAEEEPQMKDLARSHVYECLQEENKTKEDVHIVGTSTTKNLLPGDCNFHLEDHASQSHGSQSLQMFTPKRSRAANFVSLSNESNQILPPEPWSQDFLQMEEAGWLGDDGSLEGPDTEELASCNSSQSIEERNMQLRRCKKRQRRLWFEG